MAKTKGDRLWEDLQKILADKLIKKDYKTINLSNYIKINSDGSYTITVNGESATSLSKEVRERLDRAIPNGNLGQVKVDTLIEAGKGNTGAAQQMGRYFEWRVYDELLTMAKNRFTEAKVFNTMVVPELSFIGQRVSLRTPELIDLRAGVEESARLAAQLLVEELGANIVEAVAGSDPAGDIDLGSCMLELKFYQNWNKIQWYSFPDYILNYSLKDTTKEDGLWRKRGQEAMPKKQWTDLIKNDGFEGFINRVSSDRTAAQTFQYLLHKGKPEEARTKKILLGQSVNKEGKGSIKATLTLDLEELNKAAKTQDIVGKMDGLRYQFLVNSIKMGDMKVEDKSISQVAIPDEKGEKFKQWDEVKSTTMIFSLQRGFYAPQGF